MGFISQQRLWVVTGKGGVGKSTVAAALALASAREGARTLVCEINATERISYLLEKPEVGPEIRQIEPNLWAVNVQPEPAMREYALMVLRFQAIYKAVFENRVIRYFLRFIPSLQELVELGKILYHLQEKLPNGRWKWDRIIIDAPATGHAITFFSVPQVLLDTVPAGPMQREAEKMRDLLVDPTTTAAVLVALPEEMPVNETIELHRAFRDQLRIRTGAVVLNMFVPERFSQGDLAEVPPSLHEAVKQHSAREEMSLDAEGKLTKEIRAPLVHVPRSYEGTVRRSAVEQVMQHLGQLWGPEQ